MVTGYWIKDWRTQIQNNPILSCLVCTWAVIWTCVSLVSRLLTQAPRFDFTPGSMNNNTGMVLQYLVTVYRGVEECFLTSYKEAVIRGWKTMLRPHGVLYISSTAYSTVQFVVHCMIHATKRIQSRVLALQGIVMCQCFIHLLCLRVSDCQAQHVVYSRNLIEPTCSH